MIVYIDEFIVFIIASGGSGGISVEGQAGTRAELPAVALPPPAVYCPSALAQLQLRLWIHALILWLGSSSPLLLQLPTAAPAPRCSSS